jgi:hypothetical protein
VVEAYNRIARELREFVADEVALACGFSPTGAHKVVAQSLGLAALPGMLEAIDGGLLTSNHALCVLRELDAVELSVEQRAAIAYVVVHRAPGRTPGELMKLTQKLILQVDLPAALDREQVATGRRMVSFYGAADGQAVTQVKGPAVDQAAIKASLEEAKKRFPKPEGVTAAQWEYQLVLMLLTGQAEPGQWRAMVVTPFTTAGGGDLELAELPGYGPILPSTARQLLEDADWSQVAVDEHGVVIAVGDPVPAPRRPADTSTAVDHTPDAGPFRRPTAATSRVEPIDWDAERLRLMSTPRPEHLRPERIAIPGYVPSKRIKRYLQARDRHCVFPGCHQRVTDVDHRIPWPLGPTSPENLELLCRHHHRAKQALFSVELTDDGDYLWTTRGGWQFLRQREGY